MGWGLAKAMAKEALGCRTLMLAALAALLGGLIVALVGVMLVRAALAGTTLSAQQQWGIVTLAAVIYAAAGAVVGAQLVIVAALVRAVTIASKSLEPAIDAAVAKALAQMPASEKGIAIGDIDRLVDRVFDAMKESTELPILRHVALVAAAVGKWRCRREIEPFLAPMRSRGETHISADSLRTHLTRAASRTVVAVGTWHVRRSRVLVWVITAALLGVPGMAWIYRSIASPAITTQPTTDMIVDDD